LLTSHPALGFPRMSRLPVACIIQAAVGQPCGTMFKASISSSTLKFGPAADFAGLMGAERGGSLAFTAFLGKSVTGLAAG
jgi:hypothetical protein